MVAVLKKELHRIFSDPKLIFTTFLLGPIVMIGIIAITASVSLLSLNSVKESVPGILINNCPSIIKNAEIDSRKYNMTYLHGLKKDELKAKYDEGKIDLILSFPEDFDYMIANYKESEIPVIDMIYDSTNDFSEKAHDSFFEEVIEVEAHNVLIDRFKNESYLSVYKTNDLSLELKIYEDKHVLGKILSKFLPYLLFITIFGSAMGLVIESIAGEKERGTLATQLLTPLPRQHIAFGKLFGLSIMSIIATIVSMMVITITGFVVIKLNPQFFEKVAESIGYGFGDFMLMIAILVPSVLMNTSLIMVLSAFGKSLKEANGYVMPLYLITVVVSTIPMSMASGEAAQLWQYAIPIYGQVIALMEIFKFTASPLGIVIAASIPIIISVIMIFIIRNIFNNERMIVSQ